MELLFMKWLVYGSTVYIIYIVILFIIGFIKGYFGNRSEDQIIQEVNEGIYTYDSLQIIVSGTFLFLCGPLAWLLAIVIHFLIADYFKNKL